MDEEIPPPPPRNFSIRACLRCREREPGRLQLRVVLAPHEDVHAILVEEKYDEVEVLVVVGVDDPPPRRPRELIDVPCHVYLEDPLGDREVVDLARRGAPVLPYVPDW